MKTRLVILSLFFAFLEPRISSAADCGPSTQPKVTCSGSGNHFAARLCTNRRNGLAWEWISVSAAEAKELCADPAEPDTDSTVDDANTPPGPSSSIGGPGSPVA